MTLCEPRNVAGVFGPCGWCGAAEGLACPMLDPSAEVQAARMRLISGLFEDVRRGVVVQRIMAEAEQEAEALEVEGYPNQDALEDEARLWRPRAPAERRPLKFRPVGRPMGSVGPHGLDKRPMEVKVQEALARLEIEVREIVRS